MTWQEWIAAVKSISQLWPGTVYTPDSLSAWYKQLKHHDASRVQRAVENLSRKNKFAPALAEIVLECKSVPGRDESIHLLPPADENSECMDLLKRLIRGWRRGKVPLADYMALTEDRPGRFHGGKATGLHVLELRQYLETLDLMDEPAPEGTPLEMTT